MTNVRVAVDRDKGGFKLVAKRMISKDEEFLTENPFIAINSRGEESQSINCAHCFACLHPMVTNSSPMPSGNSSRGKCQCPQCGVKYCSDICRRVAYGNHHRVLCPATETGKQWVAFKESLNMTIAQSSFSLNACMALRLMIQARCQGLPSGLDIPEIKVLRRATDSNDPISPGVAPPLVERSKCVLLRNRYDKFWRFCPTLLSPRSDIVEFATLHSVIAMNAMGGRTERGGVASFIDSEVHLAASFANHDCDPNTTYNNGYHTVMLSPMVISAFPKPSISFTALRDIQQGEEITITYVDNHGMDYLHRQVNLEETYGIRCSCARCVNDRKLIDARAANEKRKSAEKAGVK